MQYKRLLLILISTILLTTQTLCIAQSANTHKQIIRSNITGVAFKELSASDVGKTNKVASDITSVSAIRKLLGRTRYDRHKIRFIYLDDNTTLVSDTLSTWYDALMNKKEAWVLYYGKNSIITKAKEGDILTLIKLQDGDLIGVIAKQNSKVEKELLSFFNVTKAHVGTSGYYLNKRIIQQLNANDYSSITAILVDNLHQLGKNRIPLNIYYLIKEDKYKVNGIVSKVSDGDTFKIGNDFLDVRLFGIDTPEKKQTCKRDNHLWQCGKEATQYLKTLILGKKVRCIGRDKSFGRLVYECTMQDGKNISEEILKEGLGVIYYSKQYVEAETQAREKEMGLWNSEFITPHDWRRGKRFD